MIALVRALDHGAGRAALIRIFELRIHARGPEIGLGSNPGLAQLRNKALIAGEVLSIEHEDHNRPAPRRARNNRRVDRFQRRIEPRNANGKASRGDILAAEAANEPVIAPAPADRAPPPPPRPRRRPRCPPPHAAACPPAPLVPTSDRMDLCPTLSYFFF